MSLKTIVKVGSITNLSDARYCSGMGVDMLGFRVIEGQANYISPKQFQEIRGWVVGPKIVAEIYGFHDPSALSKIITDYRPDYLEMGTVEFKALGFSLPIPFILSLTPGESFPSSNTNPEFILLSDLTGIESYTLPVMLKVHEQAAVDLVLTSENIKGISLNGSHEIKPGLKDYDVLAEILESLEVEN